MYPLNVSNQRYTLLYNSSQQITIDQIFHEYFYDAVGYFSSGYILFFGELNKLIQTGICENQAQIAVCSM